MKSLEVNHYEEPGSELKGRFQSSKGVVWKS
jgi:hypothetical protein